MSNLTRILIGVIAGMLVGGGAYVAAAGGDDDGTPTVSTTTTTTTAATTGTTTVDDVSGPCDEAEHANDPRCSGPQRPEDDHGVAGDDDAFDDHDGDDDGRHNRGLGSPNSGPGSAHDRGDDHPDDSGPGNAENRGDDDSRGDDRDDDSSGSHRSGSGSGPG